MNKKAALGEQVFGIFEIILFISILGVSIASGTYLFYGKGYDLREAEANLLNYKVKNCVIENKVDADFFSSFFDKCKLDKAIIEKNNIFKICLNSEDCINAEKAEFQSGSNFVACGLNYKRSPIKCAVDELAKNGERFQIVTGSKQLSSRGAS